MNAFSFGLSSAIVARQFSVTFSDVIFRAAIFGASSAMVIIARVFQIVIGPIVPIRRPQLFGRLGEAVEGGNEIRQAAFLGVGFRQRQPLSYCHARFTETETPSPTCRNDV